MEEKHINKKITFSIVAVLLIVLVTIGATYAYFSAQAQTDIQTVTTGTLTMGFTNGEIINATGIVPINDNEIETKATSLPFSITNTGNQHMNITIKLTDITIDDALKDVDFRWGLYNPDKQDAKGTEMGIAFGIFKYSENSKEEIIYRDSIIDAGAPTKNYKLRIWLHDDGALQNEMQGKTFSAKVTVTGEAIEYTDESCFKFDSSTGAITQYSDFDEVYVEEEDYYAEYRIYNDVCTRDVVIPRTINNIPVTKIDHGAFYNNEDEIAAGNPGISSIILPDTVTSIGDDVFESNNLKHITLPESVTSIGAVAFSYNDNLSTIFIPESLTHLGYRAFTSSALEIVILPGNAFTGLDGGGNQVFDGNNLTDVILMDGFNGDSSITNGMFTNNQLTSIELPSSVDVMFAPFLGNTNLTEIIVRGKSSAADFGYDNEEYFYEFNCVDDGNNDSDYFDVTCLKQANVIFRP